MEILDLTRGGRGAGLLAENVAAGRRFILRLRGPWRPDPCVALGGWERCSPHYKVERNSYPFAVIELVAGGGGEAVAGGRRIPLSAGVCFAVKAGASCRISTDPARPLEKYFFALAGGSVPALLRSAGLGGAGFRKVAGLGEFREIADLVIREAQAGGSRAAQVCSHLIRALLEKIAEQPPDGAPEPGPGGARARARFEECRAFIDANALALRSLSDAAAALRLDPSSLCRLFRRFLGVPPHQYLLRRKMSAAAALLTGRGATVQAVARRVGFEDPFHFSRVFKAVHGLPPSGLQRISR